MKVTLIHTGYFFALLFPSFVSFFVILGAGFGGNSNIFSLTYFKWFIN
ncbi:hypothetical protein SAMN05216389_102182 [Oceanobacillus limi]|uniref:Uncharacterized protein n=1 Tax=Oceanobacillus limi TaxID=930131 RepID=A0A1H9ZBS8_9BACI|nr:hypothetical protein SAMN05216389_102182 [Oceanobacillus limi]